MPTTRSWGKYTVYDPEKFATVKVHVTSRDPQMKYIVQLLDGNGTFEAGAA